MHFTDARDILMQKYHWSRRVATLAIRIAKGVDYLYVLQACKNFTGTPVISWEEWLMVTQQYPTKISEIVFENAVDTGIEFKGHRILLEGADAVDLKCFKRFTDRLIDRLQERFTVAVGEGLEPSRPYP